MKAGYAAELRLLAQAKTIEAVIEKYPETTQLGGFPGEYQMRGAHKHIPETRHTNEINVTDVQFLGRAATDTSERVPVDDGPDLPF